MSQGWRWTVGGVGVGVGGQYMRVVTGWMQTEITGCKKRLFKGRWRGEQCPAMPRACVTSFSWLADGSCRGAAWMMACSAGTFAAHRQTLLHFTSFLASMAAELTDWEQNRQAGNQLRHLRAPRGPSLSHWQTEGTDGSKTPIKPCQKKSQLNRPIKRPLQSNETWGAG